MTLTSYSSERAAGVPRSATLLLFMLALRAASAEQSAVQICAVKTDKIAAAGDYASFSSQLSTHLKELTAKDEFSGAALVARQGQSVFVGAYGCADRERKILNTADTKFRLGSMNKMFTAVAVLQLAEAHKIRLDDPVGHYLKHYPNKEVATKVTIRELLTHTGGTGDIFGPEFNTHRLELRRLEDHAKLYGNRAPLFTPGSRFSYSNYGFILLGLAIERVSGQSYYDYVRDHVFKPAGMFATDSLPESVSVSGRALGYRHIENVAGWQSNAETLPFRGTSAGGGYSTVGDLLRFADALSSNTLLSKQWTDFLTAGTVEMTWPGFKYGHGFMETVQNGVRWVGHDGSAEGMNAEFWMSPDLGYVLIVLANIDPPSALALTQWMAPLLPR